MAATRFTFIMEYLQPTSQHVEYFDFEEAIPQFITFVPTSATEPAGLSHGMHPAFCFKIAEAFALPSVHYEEFKPEDLDGVMMDIRGDYGKEGRVLYFLDEHSRVFGLLKKKTVWYVMVRAIREKVRHRRHSFVLSWCTCRASNVARCVVPRMLNTSMARGGDG